MSFSCHARGLLGGALVLGACAGAPRIDEAPEVGFQRGVALGFLEADPAAQEGRAALERVLAEVRGLGATDVSILVPLYTESIEGSSVRRAALDDGGGAAPATTPEAAAAEARRSDNGLLAFLQAAQRKGLHVLVFPIVRLRQRRPGEWRGTLHPVDKGAWFADYARELEAIAVVCAAGGAARLSIGSELVSFEEDSERWRGLATSLRARYPGRLLYSANWDRYGQIRFWDAVDEIGVSAYFTLAQRGQSPTVTQIEAAWVPIAARLRTTATAQGRPIVFTEVGYPSVEGAAFWPWNDHLAKKVCAEGEGCEGALDLETQRRLWTGFVNVFAARARSRFLSGAYAWLWSGAGGLRDRGYMPRGKPAEAVLRLWYAVDRLIPPLR